MLATLVNATAGVALEMDEGNRFGGGHPAIHCLPGAHLLGDDGDLYKLIGDRWSSVNLSQATISRPVKWTGA